MEEPKVLTRLDTRPKVEDFVSLAEHQAQTPASFFGGRPVLHFHATSATAYIPASLLEDASLRERLHVFRGAAPASGMDGDERMVQQTVDVFVNSETFAIFSQDAVCGVAIPYPLIGLHAMKTLERAAPAAPAQCVFLQLDLRDGGADDDEFDTIDLTIVPPAPATSSPLLSAPTTSAETSTTSSTGAPPTSSSNNNGARSSAAPSPAQALFAAITACAELHPDPQDDDDDDDDEGGDGWLEVDDRIVFEGGREAVEGFTQVFRGAPDGGLPPPLPGSSGWITAENVDEYFDAEGNWIGGGDEEETEAEAGVSGELGEGAGRVRHRDELETADPAEDGDRRGTGGATVNGHRDDIESKRLRTE